MKIISANSRVTIGLISLAISIWMIAFSLGMFPDRQGAVIDGRIALCENVGLNCSLLANRNDWRNMKIALTGLVDRNRQVQSAAIRGTNGKLRVSVGEHEFNWHLPPGGQSTETQMRVPIFTGNTEWGTVELRFQDSATQAGTLLSHPLFPCAAFIAAATYLMYYFYLGKMLRHLDPTKVIPRRVRQTLDTLAEGLLVLDREGRILLANQSFANSIGESVNELVGCKASDLPWEIEASKLKIEGFPWQRAMRDSIPQLGDLLVISGKQNQRRVMKVSAMPVFGEDGIQRGAMASFDDVTEIEQNREHLKTMLDSLSESRDAIHLQNIELERLASRDPLTDCLNRRAFFTELENHWSTATRHNHPLACIMVDLDHFKSINDTHGHHTGDVVLEMTSKLLKLGRRPSDLVCRYGGEEFCILLPHTEIDAAGMVAEQLRELIAKTDYEGISVTASIGVSARSLGAADPQVLIDQADKSLYIAKRNGRDRVVRFDLAIELISEFEQSNASSITDRRDNHLGAEEGQPTIPFHAVSALLSALAYRDPATVEHSRRVADFCVATAGRMMSTSESYLLEIAALLHDIGKIGVPDSILLKPGKLTEEEWKAMNSHERIGVEIVQSTFANPKLAEIVRTYRAWFGGNSQHPEWRKGDDIPLAARILCIADAFDSMTKSTTYRISLSREDAFAELRRCGGLQFDPELVERFIDTVSSQKTLQTTDAVVASNAAALSFGTQIERLADALDNMDRAGIAALAERLNLTATKYESTKIADVASQLEQAARGDHDVKGLVILTNELVDLCRSAQRAYLHDALKPAPPNGDLPHAQLA